MDSAKTTAETADQLLVANNVIKLELSDKSKRANSYNNPVLPFVNTPQTDSSSYGNTPLSSASSSYVNPSSVDPKINSEGYPVANFDVGSLRYLENVRSNQGIYKAPEESKPILADGSFISDLVPKKHELRSHSMGGSRSRSGSQNSDESRPLTGTPPSNVASSYIRNYNNSCSLNDLPSGSTEADFGIVKEELHIEDIEEGAEYSCLSSHNSLTENLFSNSLPESIEPFIKETEPESLLKTDNRMNENVTQENVPQLLELLNNPVKPVRRQRVKKTPKIGARLSSVINKLAQSKETLILSKSDPSNSANSQSSITAKSIPETYGGSTQPDNGRPAVPPTANTASIQTTVQSFNNAQVISNSTNQCLANSISNNKCDEFSIPSTNSISTSSDSLDKTKSILVVDRLKRLGTSIEVEKPTTDAFQPNSTVGRTTVDGLSKSEPSITIEPQPFVTTRSLSQALPTMRPPPTKSKPIKKTLKPAAVTEATTTATTKVRNVKTSVSSVKTKPAPESNESSLNPNPSPLEPSDNTNSIQYNKCQSALESLVKADDMVKDITKNCIKNKTNRKINKNVLKYDSKLSKQNWKSNLVTNESSPSKTTLILNKTIPSKTKIKIINPPIDEASQQTNPISKETESFATSQKIDGESVKVIMDKHDFTIGEDSVLEVPNGQKLYTCDVCSGVYQKGFSLKRHYLRSHINYYFIRVKESEANGQFTIQLSGGCDDNGGLDKAKALLYRCHVCGNCFPLKSELKCHLTAHPPVNSISSNDVKVYECINCSSVFNKKKEFSKHRKTCVIEVPVAVPKLPAPKQRLNEKLPCLFCLKVFPSAMERKKHGLKMHFPKKKVHPCFKCVETFQTQSAVYQHLREIHKNDYFSCSACKERFHNDLELKAHCMKKHNGNTAVMAVLNDTNGVIDSFEEKEEKAEKPEKLDKPAVFRCSVCPKVFSSQSNLNKHTKTMHSLGKDDKITLSPKHVVILSKASLASKETKDSKTKTLDLKKNPTSKSKSDAKSKDPDTAFYSELSDNIQFNLMHHIDGKLHNEKTRKDVTVPTAPETTATSSQSTVPAKSDLPSKVLSQLDLVGKTTVNKGASTSLQCEEKPKSDRYSDTLNYTEDMSHLDIATQLTMKRNLRLLNSSMSRAKTEADTSQVCGIIRLKRVKDLSKDLAHERPETLCAESYGDNSFENIESNIGLSGFWTRPHNYVCVTCQSQSVNFWEMEDHKWNSHPNVKCAHYEFSENHLPGWEFFTSRTFGSEGLMAPETKPEVPAATTSKSRCSKCKKLCSSALELHRHMLECGLDTTWMLTLMPSPSKKQKEKKKWRPFGSRRRRMSRVRGFKRNIPNSPMKIIMPPKLPKSKSGDTESIQKMIANLPAKRATRRVVIFDNVSSKAGQATINSVPITSLNWNNNTYENGLLENLLKNDQQGEPSGSVVDTSNGSIPTSVDSKDGVETNSSKTDVLSNPSSGTRIVPIWPPAEQSDVLTSLRMMPIPQVPMVIEPIRPVLVPKAPELEVKPAIPEVSLKPAKPVKPFKKLRSLVRQLSASSLEGSPTESSKKPTTPEAEKSPSLSSRSSSPKEEETSVKVNGGTTEKAPIKTASAPTSPTKMLVALSKYSVKKPSDLAKEKSTILDAMRIAMANSKLSENSFISKSGKGKKLLKKSFSESLLIGKDASLKPESISSDKNPFLCASCGKIFKNGAVLKRHLAKCAVASPSEDVSIILPPELSSAPGPSTDGGIKSLVSQPIRTVLETNTSPVEKKKVLPQSKPVSENDTLSKPSQSEDTALKPPNSKTKKTAGKITLLRGKAVDPKVVDKNSKTLKTRTLKKASDMPKPEDLVIPLVDIKSKIGNKLPSGKEELGSNPVIPATGASDETTKQDQNPPPKSKKKISIMKRSVRANPTKDKINVTAVTEVASITETKTNVDGKQSQIAKVTATIATDNHVKTQSVDDVLKPPIPDKVPSNLVNDMSSDSDSDSTPLVQLKEIIKKTFPVTKEKKQKKVMVKKVKGLKKKPTKKSARLRKNLIRVKFNRSTVKLTEEASSKLIDPNPLVKDSKKPDLSQLISEEATGKLADEAVSKAENQNPDVKDKKKLNSAQLNTDKTIVKPEEAVSKPVAQNPAVKNRNKSNLPQLVDETPLTSKPGSSVKTALTTKALGTEELKTQIAAVVAGETRSRKLVSSAKKRRKQKRLIPRSKQKGLLKMERKGETKKSSKTAKNIDERKDECEKSSKATKKIEEVNAGHDAGTKLEDEIKDEPDLDESFRLFLTDCDEAEKEDQELFTTFSSPLKEKQDSDIKTDVKEEPAYSDSMHVGDAAEMSAKQDALIDSKSSSSGEEAPSKPKRKRCSAYNLLFTHLKQEDIKELLTTIQADRQNLKRKCTLVEPQPAVEKKPRKVCDKSQSDGEGSDKKFIPDVKEIPPQSENAATESSTNASEKPDDTAEVAAEPIRLSRRGKPVSASNGKEIPQSENTNADSPSNANEKSNEMVEVVTEPIRSNRRGGKPVSVSNVKETLQFEIKDTENITNANEKGETEEVVTEAVRSNRRGKLVSASNAGNVKKSVRSASAGRTSKVTRSSRAAENLENQAQTTLDNWIQSEKQGSSSEITADSKVGKKVMSTSGGKPKQKQTVPDESDSAGTSEPPVITSEAQISVNTRKNKSLKSSLVSKKTNPSDDKFGPELKSVSKSTVRLRSAAETKNDEVPEGVKESPSETTHEISKESQNKTDKLQPVVSSRTTRAKKSSLTKISDVPNSDSASASELELKSADSMSEVSTLIASSVSNESIVNGSNDSLSKSKNVDINAKITVNFSKNVEVTKSVINEVSNTSIHLKKRKRPKRSTIKSTNSEATSDDDNLPLSSLGEGNSVSSLSRVNSEDTELSDDDQETKKLCQNLSTSSLASMNAEDIVASDDETESPSENFLPLLKAKNKSKNLKRKRRKEILRKNLLNNLDSPMTSDSETSILRVHKKQLKNKKSNFLASEISSALEENDALANNTLLRKQLAKLKTKKDLKKVLDLIKKGGNSVSDADETSDPPVLENSLSSESLSSNVNVVMRKKKLKKKKSKKKLKNKDLVNVLVQTVAKTANKLLTKKSAEQLRKKQLKLQRRKALKKLSHANNDWQISIVNPESNETLTTEVPDSSNDLEENKKEIDSDKANSVKANSNLSVAMDDADSNQVVNRLSKKFCCSLCDKNFGSLVTLNKHYLTWKHRYNVKLLAQHETCDSLKVGSIFNSSAFDNTQINLSSLKNKLVAAAKPDETPAVVSEPPPVSTVSTVSVESQELPASTNVSDAGSTQPVPAARGLEPVEESPWLEQEWSEQGWQMNPAPEPVNSWFQDAWPKTNSFGSTSLGSILDSVNQILADPSSADPHSDPMSQYSLADLQQAICATDDEMALLQQLGENCPTGSESEYVYDNSATQQGSQPVSFNEWTCESTDLIDLDNQNPWSKNPTPAAPEPSESSKSSQSGKVPEKLRPSSPEDYENVEMTCPIPTCSRHFHGITALQTHFSWSHSNNKRPATHGSSKIELLKSCMTSPDVIKSLVCFVCKEICTSNEKLDAHVNTYHVRRKLADLSPGPSKHLASDGAEKLKSKMSSAFGGLLDRALSNLKLNSLKTRAEPGESSSASSAVSEISNETLKFLGHLKERRRIENMGNKNFQSNLAKELRRMIDREKYEKLSGGLALDSVSSPRSSIDSDADVTSTTNKNEFMRPYSCPLCFQSFSTATNRNRHISVHHGRTTPDRDASKFKPIEPPRKVEPPVKKIPAPKVKKTVTRSPRKKATKKLNSDSFVDSTVPDFQCDNCHHTVSMSCDSEPMPKPRKTKKPAKSATATKSCLGLEDEDLFTDFDDTDSGSLRSFTSRTQTSSDVETESNGSQKSMIKQLQTALQVGMKKKQDKDALAQQEIQRQNDAFDQLLGKEPSKETVGTVTKKTEGYCDDPVRAQAEAALKALKGKSVRQRKDLTNATRGMPALEPVKAAPATRVPRDIPAPVLKPISSEVPKQNASYSRKKPPSLALSLPSKGGKKNPVKLNAENSKLIDTSSCDSDSCKLKSPSFCDLSEMEPYSSGMMDSPKSCEDEKSNPAAKPSAPVKKPVQTPSKCDNVSELEHLFSDDDSDQETKVETPTKKIEDKLSPESLKTFRDSMKILKDQGTSEPKSNTADVYNFED